MLRAKRRQEEERKAAAERAKYASCNPPPVKMGPSAASPARRRVQQDLSSIEECPTYKLEVPNPDDIMHFTVKVTPVDSFYEGGEFVFSVAIPDDYPFSPPKVHCDTTVYHPFIDLDGHVCLNILRTDWKPVLDIQTLLYGLVLLFDTPDPEALSDPLNSTIHT